MFSFKNLIIILSVLWISLHWTEAQKSNASLNRPNFQISHLNLEPIIDGNILNDKVWQGISPITQMIQIKPEFNVPSTEKTEIRVATYKNTFYVAVVCYDSTPENIVVSDSRRDSDLNDEDSFLFILDTYNDLQNGFLFGTNSNDMMHKSIMKGKEISVQIDNRGV